MTESKETLKNENEEIDGEFPFPKLIKLFDFFFPKQKGYKPIDWRGKLKIWALWSPWLTLTLLIVILCFLVGNDPFIDESKVGVVAGLCLIGSLIKSLYYFGVAIVAKCLKRSPVVALSLAPVTALWSVGLLCTLQIIQFLLFGGGESAKKDAGEKPYALQKTEKEEISVKMNGEDQGDATTSKHPYRVK